MAAIAFSLNKIAIFSYYYLAVNASIAGIAFVSDGSEAMRFKSGSDAQWNENSR